MILLKGVVSMYDVAILGIIVADVMAKPVDSFPGKGQLDTIDSVEIFSGGNAMTATLNMTKLGSNPVLMGMIGNDSFGDFFVKHMAEKGIDGSGVKRTDKVQTSVSIVLSGTDGERTFLHCPGANGAFDISDINFDIINQAKTVFVTGSFLLNNFDGEQTVEFLKRCKEMGKTTTLDVCWNRNANPSWLINDAMPYIDIFMPSIDEAKMITGKESLADVSKSILEHGAKAAVIKCGGDGCFVRESLDEEGIMISGLKNIEVVDTTGAGDSFCSGFLSAFSRGYSIKESARFGNAVGACCVMKKGASEGTLTFDETLELLNNN